MKRLNEMTTDESLDLLCAITPYVSNIAEDKEFVKILSEKVKLGEDTTDQEFKEIAICKGIEKATKMIPLILKTHRDDVFNIISLLNNKTVDEIKAQNIKLTINEVKEIIMDKEFLDFFIELVK